VCGKIKTSVSKEKLVEEKWVLLKEKYSEKHLKGTCYDCQLKTELKEKIKVKAAVSKLFATSPIFEDPDGESDARMG